MLSQTNLLIINKIYKRPSSHSTIAVAGSLVNWSIGWSVPESPRKLPQDLEVGGWGCYRLDTVLGLLIKSVADKYGISNEIVGDVSLAYVSLDSY